MLKEKQAAGLKQDILDLRGRVGLCNVNHHICSLSFDRAHIFC